MGDINNGGTGLLTLIVAGLQILFIGLKITGYIDWGWGWVLAPLWISVIVGVVLGAIVIAIAIWATN